MSAFDPKRTLANTYRLPQMCYCYNLTKAGRSSDLAALQLSEAEEERLWQQT